MSDPVDRLPCQDVVCARGGHFVCHDMPPPKHDARCALNDMNPPPLCTCRVGPSCQSGRPRTDGQTGADAHREQAEMGDSPDEPTTVPTGTDQREEIR